MEKEKLIERFLKESKLGDDHKTETFRKTLLTCEKEEDMKSLIEDREKICVAKEASVNQPGSGTNMSGLSEGEQLKRFNQNIFGETVEDIDVKMAVAGTVEVEE